MPVVEWFAPKAGERILDPGCGDGLLAQRLALSGCEVVGIDTNRALVEAAKARGVDARVMNGEAIAFDGEFDAVFSKAALHWMRRHDRVIDGAWRALKKGGRFVAECGGKGNIDGILAGYAGLSPAGGWIRLPCRRPGISRMRRRWKRGLKRGVLS